MQWKHIDSQLKRNLELSRQPGTVSVPAYGHAVIFHNYIRSDCGDVVQIETGVEFQNGGRLFFPKKMHT